MDCFDVSSAPVTTYTYVSQDEHILGILLAGKHFFTLWRDHRRLDIADSLAGPVSITDLRKWKRV
ncbi:hypothetical protein ANCCAN_22053 [Ancylostoma caninum]|uniref:Uncharacterized protein n=1 Tax=Ancylostoma caninum TaxID=29170 RepID=A0A368FJA3_ANCCA|nr:hypothetical protein ANCCAN_22053 [Ancylostoma caninum]